MAGYRETMALLSACDLGAVLVRDDKTIMEINEAGRRLSRTDGDILGKPLDLIMSFFTFEDRKISYAHVGFNAYLVECPAPEIEDLPAGMRLIVFRDATKEIRHDMMLNILNRIKESVILCDEYSRILFLNDAAVKMDSLLTEDISGRAIGSVYNMTNESFLAVPRVIEEKKPLLNLRQQYTTCYGKNVDIVCNNYPVVEEQHTLGGFSVMEDWSQIDELNKHIIDLQGKLIEHSASLAKNKAQHVLSAKYKFKDIIHISAAMQNVVKKCQHVARSDSSVMIYGETGTGKELFSQSIHSASRRAGQPFLAVNCAAIPENLLESMLFGTEKGAFTGAERREGLFEQANNGTLLLDEINSMNISLQSKLLRVLQDGVIRRVGGVVESRVDVRVLSNINIPPFRAIEEKLLRQDLYYRLGVVNINLPPLRQHKEDIHLLAKNFIFDCNKKLLKNVRDIDAATLELFHAYDWPGNVRELQHAIEHAMNMVLDEDSLIAPAHIPEHIIVKVNGETPKEGVAGDTTSLDNILDEVESRVLKNSLKEHGSNIAKTARALGISRQNLQYRIKRHGIDVSKTSKIGI
jgi:arginine utilization regulatory protein